MGQWHRKSLLGTVENTGGNSHYLRQFPQRVFLRAPAKLPPRTQTCNPFYKDMIQKRRPYFKRRGHAHAINLGKDIAGEVSLAVQIHEPGDAVRKPRSAEIIAHGLRRVVSAGAGQKVRGVQTPLPALRRKKRDRIDVTIRWGKR